MTAPRVATVAQISGTGPGEIPRWVERWGAIVLAVGLSFYLITTAIWLLAYAHQVDMSIYRFGGESLIHGRPLYDVGLSGKPEELLFNYPPFAAVVFAPLALVPLPALRLIVPIGNLLLLAIATRRCWRAMGIRGSWELRSLTMMGVGALIWLEPVHTTIALGQIGLVLLAVLLLDLLPLSGERRWSGVGVGLAAGVKLTPLFFIPYLLLTGRVRAAVVASATFAATVGVGFLVAPSQGVAYWVGGTFHDLSRIVAPGTSGNASIYGLLSRTSLRGGALTAVWLTAATLTAAACLVVAARAHARGEVLLGVALCGLGSAAVSPYSWGYQWVWFVPLAVFLAHRAIVLRNGIAAILLGVLWIATAAWITEWRSPITGETPPDGLISLHPGGWVESMTRSIYLIALAGAVMLAAVFLRPRAAGHGRRGRDPSDPPYP